MEKKSKVDQLSKENTASVKKELKEAEIFVKKHIMPKFDELVDKHKKDGVISQEEVKEVITSVLKKMMKEKLIDPDDANKVEDYFGKRGEFNTESLKFETKLDRTMDSLRVFDAKNNLVIPTIETLKDKLNYTAYKCFSKIGLKSMGLACRGMMSPKSREDLNKFEDNITKLMATAIKDAVAGQGVEYYDRSNGQKTKAQINNASTPKAGQAAGKIEDSITVGERTGKYAQAIVAKRREKTTPKERSR